MSEIEKMDLESTNLVDERVERMRELFPEVFSEGGINFDKLRLELGDEVDAGDERYAFTWPGKRDAIRQSQTVSTATLRPCSRIRADEMVRTAASIPTTSTSRATTSRCSSSCSVPTTAR